MKAQSINTPVSIILILLGTILVTFFAPFWAVLPLFFGIGYFTNLKPLKMLITAFLIPFIVWVAYVFITDSQAINPAGSLLDDLIGLPSKSSLILTGLISGFIGGFSALSGNLLGSWSVNKT